MKILLDMNLSPMLCGQLAGEGWQTAHWQDIGAPDATHREIMAWALEHGYVVCTNDLDVGTLLAQTQSGGPSVTHFRLGNVSPLRMGSLLIAALHRYEQILEKGALIVVDEAQMRARILPLTVSS